MIKKNVVANNIVNYTRLYPVVGGIDFVYVQAFDIAGSIPEYLKNKGADAQARSPMTQIHIIKTGQAPWRKGTRFMYLERDLSNLFQEI